MDLSKLKLKPGNAGASIVANDPLVDVGMHPKDIEYYGGHLVAESIPPEIRPLFLAAPELLAACEQLLEILDNRQPHLRGSDVRVWVRDVISRAKGKPDNGAQKETQ